MFRKLQNILVWKYYAIDGSLKSIQCARNKPSNVEDHSTYEPEQAEKSLIFRCLSPLYDVYVLLFNKQGSSQ